MEVNSTNPVDPAGQLPSSQGQFVQPQNTVANVASQFPSLTQLTSLNLTGVAQIVDYSFLQGLTQLTSLNLTGAAQIVD